MPLPAADKHIPCEYQIYDRGYGFWYNERSAEPSRTGFAVWFLRRVPGVVSVTTVRSFT